MNVIARFYTPEGDLMQLRADDARSNAVVHRYDHNGEHEVNAGAFADVSAQFAAQAGMSLAQMEAALVPDAEPVMTPPPVVEYSEFALDDNDDA